MKKSKEAKVEPAPIKIDDHSEEVASIEEKDVADPILAPTEEGADDEAAIDDEEVNPFGDKWEM